jgi:hypothetical protein
MIEFFLGILGVIVGGAVQFGFNLLGDRMESRQQRKLDERRKELLKHALENPPNGKEWRSIQTLSRIIGADYETTTRLLIEVGARGSESENDVWALIEAKPLKHR